MVGCIIVKDNVIVGQGFHERAGEPHAEINALKMAGTQAQGATLYVNLEPCCHQGRTPPCADAIIKAGIAKVVLAMQDPNPLVAGGGITKLRSAHIEVIEDILKKEAQTLNRAFCHYITTKTPFIIAKWAMSLDGKMAVLNQKERQLSSQTSQEEVHELRQCTQAILIGSGTARIDNPSLTVRLGKTIIRQPQRIVLNTKADLDPQLKLFNGELPEKTWLICAKKFETAAKERFNADTTEIITLPGDTITIPSLLKEVGARGIMSVLLEGGPTLLQEFISARAVQEIICYIAPWFVGTLPNKIALGALSTSNVGTDIKIKTIMEH
jgi:diaminohydroxyphosphoribosylaminopyrimidine deaminase/5-amino-6-(5-phosphoribosylamino)uracil reductase